MLALQTSASGVWTASQGSTASDSWLPLRVCTYSDVPEDVENAQRLQVGFSVPGALPLAQAAQRHGELGPLTHTDRAVHGARRMHATFPAPWAPG
jgi:hypothetical protein